MGGTLKGNFKQITTKKCKAEFIFAVKHFYDRSNLTAEDFAQQKISREQLLGGIWAT